MKAGQLRLVRQEPLSMGSYSASADPVARVFGEWLFWFGKQPARCKLGPQRRAAIAGALVLYDEAMLVQALIGAAADEWLAQQDGLGVEWVLAGESRIERFATVGQRLQARAAAAPVQAERADAPSADDLAAGAAARERMRALVQQMSGRAADA